MADRNDLLPLIDDSVGVKRKSNGINLKGTLMDVGQRYVFLKSERRGTELELSLINLSDIEEVTFSRPQRLSGPFDGSRGLGK